MKTRVILFSICLVLVPLIVDAATAPRTFRELASQIVDVLMAGVASLLALAIVIFVWGIASKMAKLGEGDPGAYKDYIMWGIVILFVMVSIWGILRLLQATFLQGSEEGGVSLQHIILKYDA